ncbi:MAG: hypothetical protein GXX96_21625 [Planctomycetaceae bacterium]|nr:hypothetical protein [Planctomycetaceae bacterium]
MVRSNRTAAQAFLLVLLLWAAANAVSYFVRSDGWGNLLGQAPQNGEAIGVPWLIWSGGGAFGTSHNNWLALLGNTAVTLLSAVAAYAAVARFTRRFPDVAKLPDEKADTHSRSPRRALQFRLRTLLALVVVEAIVLGGIRSYGDARPALLAAIYLLGPSLLLAVAWRLRDVIPTHRNLALLLVGLLFVPAAAVLGESIEGIRDFTRGLLGLFVCWVPQCVLLAVVISAFRGRFAEHTAPVVDNPRA